MRVDIADVAKRLLVGRPVRSDRMGHTLLPKRIALPVFASDALSSVAYAPDEILLTLALAGGAAIVLSPWVGLAVVAVLLVVVLSYRQNVHAYPSGGGDYEVVSTNLGPRAGLTVAGALLVDYVLTVAVSISSGAQYVAAAFPALAGHEAGVAVGLILLLTVINLRGVRESGSFLAVPTYLYMAVLGSMIVTGLAKDAAGTLGQAPSASLEIAPEAAFDQGLLGLAGVFLVLRAFSSGCAALTGIEAISNGVPAFQRPKSKNAAATLGMLGLIAAFMLIGILTLANHTGVKIVEFPAEQLLRDGRPVGEDYVQDPAIVQIAQTVFGGAGFLLLLTAIVTGFILVLAANTAFNGFPQLASVLARDGYLPRQLHTRGDRLAYSNGIIVLAIGASVLVLAYDAQVTRLIQLYIVGVFISFTFSQAGMIRHWSRLLQVEANPAVRRRIRRSRLINALGFTMTGTVLVIVVLTKFTRGAWLTMLLIALLYLLCSAIRRHYVSVAKDLRLDRGVGGEPGDAGAMGSAELDAARALPARVHALVLVSKVHQPTLRAVSYARATYPSTLEAITVDVAREDTERLRRDWLAARIPVPLTVLASPFREVTRPVVDHIRSVRRTSPRDVVVVYIPEYVVAHWWERLLHNQSALRIKSRLLFVPGVIVASVPFQIHRDDHLAAPVPEPGEIGPTHPARRSLRRYGG